MKAKKPSDQKENTNQIIQRKDGNSFVKPKGNANSFTPPRTSASKDKSLPKDLKSNMEHSLGQDFSDVSIHTNSQKAVQMNARAYTQGDQVHFAPGEFDAKSTAGKNLIGHEFTHVAQQRAGVVKPTKVLQKGIAINDNKHLEQEADNFGKKAAKGEAISKYRGVNASSASAVQAKGMDQPIQMLRKSHHPWHGRVVNAILLALRDAPDGDTLADLPDGTLVQVTADSNGWLNVTVDTSQPGIILNAKARRRLSGTTLTGYCGHRYIDDAVTMEMTDMIGGTATWISSGPGRGNTFETWASAASESAAPPLAAVTTINCWEMILLAAHRIGLVDWDWVHDLYTTHLVDWYTNLPDRLTRGALRPYDLSTSTPLPERGDLVFFNGASHVALATGNADEILTFWPPPNTTFTAGGTVDVVKTSTIDILAAWMIADPRLPSTEPTITFGTPSW
jgi:hypothetical protein